MNFFTYKFICPECEEEWQATYIKRFEKPRHVKTCPSCLKTEEVVVEDLGGIAGRGSCGGCKHFEPKHGNGWGECGLDHKLPNEEEYTLTWAIDNISSCEVPYEDHEGYGDDILGLVYFEDYCTDFEKGAPNEV